ncbi:MAG: hypothetical protein ACJARD_001375 [Alphaproteobacteria bacterium]
MSFSITNDFSQELLRGSNIALKGQLRLLKHKNTQLHKTIIRNYNPIKPSWDVQKIPTGCIINDMHSDAKTLSSSNKFLNLSNHIATIKNRSYNEFSDDVQKGECFSGQYFAQKMKQKHPNFNVKT